MRLLARFLRLIWGGDVDRALRPVLAVTFATTAALSAGWVFTGIWATTHLGATPHQLGAAWGIAAVAALAAGYLGGHASDYVGRRPLILAGTAVLTAVFCSYTFVGHHVYVGLALLAVAGVGGSIGSGAEQAMVADLVPPERHEAGYASVRVAANFGVSFGPPIGALLLIGRHWPVLFSGVSVMGAAAIAIAYRYLPRSGEYTPSEPPTRGSLDVIRRDTAFLLFLASGAFAYVVYAAYESVVPVSATKVHGMAPALWGVIVAINPVLVTLFQLRVTRWTTGWARAPKFASAMLLMGCSLLFLRLNTSAGMFAAVMVVFVIGEMLWVPTSQAIVAALSPEDIRGAYMGAFSSTGPVGFALGPMIGLQFMTGTSDGGVWYFFAGVSVLAAATGLAAIRGAVRRPAAPAVA